MTFLKILFLMTLTITTTVHAGVEKSEDVLSTVSQKLIQIEHHLKDQRVFVTAATFEWTEFNEFREDLMFVVAHDPAGQVPKDTTPEMLPSHLTQRLKVSFSRLEASVYQIEGLARHEEWTLLKTEMDQFISLREEFFYGPARGMIRSGVMTGHMDKLKVAAGIIMKGTATSKNVSVRVIDPVIEGLSQELNHLNFSVRQLKEFNKPVPVEPKTIFQPKNYLELVMTAGAALFIGFLVTVTCQWIAKKFAKEPAPVIEIRPIAFDYYEWLKGLEVNLKAFKTHEDKLTEEHITLKSLSHELHAARKGLNLAENQQDYYVSLEQLNAAAPRLEEYFEKMNIKKNAEVSRRMVKMVVQLCDAIESRHEITLTEQRGKLKASNLNAA
jgi:hypothetical protein